MSIRDQFRKLRAADFLDSQIDVVIYFRSHSEGKSTYDAFEPRVSITSYAGLMAFVQSVIDYHALPPLGPDNWFGPRRWRGLTGITG